MSEQIKRLGNNIQDQNVEDELNHLIEQVEHKDNVVTKESGLSQMVTINGTTLVFVNGQLTEIR